jgi:hypothetical protein
VHFPILRFSGPWLCLALLLAIPGATPAGTPQDLEGDDSLNWPKEIEAPGVKITLYQPQLETFQGNRITARAAVSLTKAGAAGPVFGGLWIEAQLLTDRDRRTATPVDVKITEARFPTSDALDTDELRRIVTPEIPKWRLTLSLDHLLAGLKIIEGRRAAAQGLRNDPPTIIYRQRPSVLVTIDGEPDWRRVPGSPYQRVANSAFFLLQDPATGTSTLHIPPFWWTAPGPLGPWQGTDGVDGAILDLWSKEPKPETPPAVPGQGAPQRPEVIAVTQPTELLWTQGPPQYAPLEGTELLYVKNTQSDMFLEMRSQLHYVLLSGRWYRKATGKGAWTSVSPDELPPDFGRISPSSEKQHVLASVAGTAQANDALLDTEIPQTVAIHPGSAPVLNVYYDGNPRFAGIEGSSVQYALNTPHSIFLAERRYYCCQNAIWYESGFATGPWNVSTRVPHDIYLIPPSCPHYYCTYCHVFNALPGIVHVGYYPGYRACFASGRTVVYGTGWNYAGWRGSVWYPRPVTWGVGVRYDVTTCDWNFRLGMGGPCAWMGLGDRSDWSGPTASVGVGGWWGGAGFQAAQIDVHHNLEFARHANQGAVHNIYARHPESLAPVHSRLPDPVRRQAPDQRAPNNVFTDPRGNVYRKPAEGGWEKHTPQGWQKDIPQTSSPGHREDAKSLPPPAHREAPKTPPVPDPRDTFRAPPLPGPREVPRTPPLPDRREAPKPPPIPERRDLLEPPRASEHPEIPPLPPHHVDLEQHNQARTAGNERARVFQQSPRPSRPPAVVPRQR